MGFFDQFKSAEMVPDVGMGQPSVQAPSGFFSQFKSAEIVPQRQAPDFQRLPLSDSTFNPELDVPGVQMLSAEAPVSQTGVLGRVAGDIARDIPTAIIKGATQTAQGIQSLDEKLVNRLKSSSSPFLRALPDLQPAILERLGISREFGAAVREEMRQTPSAALEGLGGPETVGKGIQMLGEFLVPAAKVKKAQDAMKYYTATSKILQKAGKARPAIEGMLNLGTRAATEGGTLAAITAIQSGEFGEEEKTAAMIGAVFPVAVAGIARAGVGLKNVGARHFRKIIKPLKKFDKDGFDEQTILDYKLESSSLQGVLAKTSNEIERQMKIVKNELVSKNTKVPVMPILERAEAKILDSAKHKWGSLEKFKSAMDEITDQAFKSFDDTGTVDLMDLHRVKQGLGEFGKWYKGFRDPEANIKQQVYNTFYTEFRLATEKYANVSAANKAMTKLIPVEKAIKDRLFTTQKNNWISLGDIGYFGIGGLLEVTDGMPASMFNNKAVYGLLLSKAMKTSPLGAAMVKTGRGITSATGVVTPQARIVAGGLATSPKE